MPPAIPFVVCAIITLLFSFMIFYNSSITLPIAAMWMSLITWFLPEPRPEVGHIVTVAGLILLGLRQVFCVWLPQHRGGGKINVPLERILFGLGFFLFLNGVVQTLTYTS